MKIKLTIGGNDWLAPDAVKAGKVMALLGSFTPIKRDWGNPGNKAVYVKGHVRQDHLIEIEELTDDVHIVNTKAQALKLHPITDNQEDKP